MAVALAPTQSTVFGAANVFTQADLASWDWRRRVSKRRAHAHLSDMRREMHANAENSRCLNDDELIGDYVCSRVDAASLVGDGISAVWGLFFVDGSAARFDWVLERVDGTAARIHPSSNAHGKTVYGRMEQWAPPQDRNSAPAGTRGAGRRDAQKFLEASLRTWEAKPHPRGRFFQSLLDGESFPWWLYLNSTKWGAGAGAAGAGVRHVLVAGTLQPPRLLRPVHRRRGHH